MIRRLGNGASVPVSETSERERERESSNVSHLFVASLFFLSYLFCPGVAAVFGSIEREKDFRGSHPGDPSSNERSSRLFKRRATHVARYIARKRASSACVQPQRR